MATSRPEDRRTGPRFSLTSAVFRYTGRTQSTVARAVSGRPITEPAVGYGGALGLMFIGIRAKKGRDQPSQPSAPPRDG